MRDVLHALARHAAARPDTVAFADDRTTLDWRSLAGHVAGAAMQAVTLPPVIGLLAGNSIDWVVADLGIAAAGRTLVPLPPMFADGQLAYIVASAGIGCIVADAANMARAGRFGVAVVPMFAGEGAALPDRAGEARRIIYTSGSTGTPKGVRLGDRQIGTMAAALAAAIGADAPDRYLSLLPLSLLLEELCAIHVPVLVGGHCTIASGVPDALAAGRHDVVAATVERVQLSVTVLVPDMLRAWVGALGATGTQAPASLRFVAVGGTPVPEPVAEAAWSLGIPVHEGYGLSECGSVVALNRAGARADGTVGTPLDGVGVAIEAGEIVVRGPSVMDGYVGGEDVGRVWKTGDLGHFDTAGRLVVDGRRDNLLVTANGRNVQAEWVETALSGDPRIARAFIVGHGAPALTAIVVPVPSFAPAFADPAVALAIVRAACADLPAYAIPASVIVTDMAALAAAGLLTPSGRPRRMALAAKYATASTPLPSRQEALAR